MPKYVFAYHGGKMPETPEEGAEQMAAWQAWFVSMGDAVVDAGNPVGQSYTVCENGVVDNGGANPLSGYSIIETTGMTAACELAKGCPILPEGSIEVAEIVEM